MKPWTFKSLIYDSGWIPFALLALFLSMSNSTNFPSIDQWDGEVPFLQKAAEGKAGFADIIAQHLEHRIGMNRVVGLLTANLAAWNVKFELVVTWLLVCLCAACICSLSRKIFPTHAWQRALALAFAGMLLFGIQQFDTWLNPVIMQWYFVQACLLMGLVVTGLPWRDWSKFTACLFLAAIATFSSSNGMLTWLLLFPPFLLSPHFNLRRGICMTAAWSVAAFLAILGYFWNFHKPPESPSALEALRQPVKLIHFFLANIGSPLAGGTAINPTTQAAIVGSFVVLLFLAITIYLFKHRSNRLLIASILPWMTIMVFVFATAFATSLGRSGFGLQTALASRYIATSVLSFVSLVFLVPLILRHILLGIPEKLTAANGSHGIQSGETKPSSLAPSGKSSGAAFSLDLSIKACLATGLVLLHIFYSVGIVEVYENNLIMQRSGKAAVLFMNHFSEEDLLKPYWSKPPDVMRPRVEFLQSKGYLKPGLVRSARIRDLLGSDDQGIGTRGNYGELEQAGNKDKDTLAIGGWAVFPGYQRPADSVILTYETNPDDCTVFGIAQMGMARDDIATRLNNPKYRKAGWVKFFDLSALPREPVTIRAWAFDTASAKAFELNGALTIDPR